MLLVLLLLPGMYVVLYRLLLLLYTHLTLTQRNVTGGSPNHTIEESANPKRIVETLQRYNNNKQNTRFAASSFIYNI